MRGHVVVLAAVGGLAIGLMACSVNPGTHEKSGPKVVFRQGDKNISSLFLRPNTDAPASFASASFSCDATDSGGVQSISLSFDDAVTECVFSSGCGSSWCPGTGNFHFAPSMPAPQTSTSHRDSVGQVPNELFLLAELGGTYQCVESKGAKTVKGQPFGQTVTATCGATNYSGKESHSSLAITFNPPSAAPCCSGSMCSCGFSSDHQALVCCAGYVCQSDNTCKKPKQ
jgi:hypothetical protein